MILPSGGTHVLTAVKNAQIFGSEQFLHESLNLFSLTEYWNTTAAEVHILNFKTTWSEFEVPSQTATTEAKARCVCSILKPHN